MDIFSTAVLNKTVDCLDQPASFLLDTFFPIIQTDDREEIYFDTDQSKPCLAPFVSPLIEGKVVATDGFETRSFKPAYVKDKRRFDVNAPLRRQLGENIGGELTPTQRREGAIKKAVTSQLENLMRREEIMAAEALCHGTVTVSGEDYPTQMIDFKREPDLTKTLTGDQRWGEAGVNILDQIEDWAMDIQIRSGAVARTLVMDPIAWRVFKNNERIEKLLDYRRGTDSTLNIDPMSRAQGQGKARYVGVLGDIEC